MQKRITRKKRKKSEKKPRKTADSATSVFHYETSFSLPFLGEIALRAHGRALNKLAINAATTARQKRSAALAEETRP